MAMISTTPPAKRHRPVPPRDDREAPLSPGAADHALGSVLRILTLNDCLPVASIGTLARTSSALKRYVRDDDELWAHLCQKRWPSTSDMPPAVRRALEGQTYRWIYRQRAALAPRRPAAVRRPKSREGTDDENDDDDDDDDDELVDLPPPKLALDDIAIFIDAEGNGRELASQVLTGDALLPLLNDGILPFELIRPIPLEEATLTDDGVWEIRALTGVNVSVHLLRISQGTWLRLHESYWGTDCEISEPRMEESDVNMEREGLVPELEMLVEPDYRLPVPEELRDLHTERRMLCHSFQFVVEVPSRRASMPFSPRHFGFEHVAAKFKEIHGTDGGDSENGFQDFVEDYWRGGKNREDLLQFFDQAEKEAALFTGTLRNLDLVFWCEQGKSCFPFVPKEQSKEHGVTFLHIMEILLNQAKGKCAQPEADHHFLEDMVSNDNDDDERSLEAVTSILATNGFIGPAELGRLASTGTSLKRSILNDEMWASLCQQRWPSTAKMPPVMLEGRGYRWLHQQRSSIVCLPWKGPSGDLPQPKLTKNDLALFVDIIHPNGRQLVSDVLTGDALVPLLEKGSMPIPLKFPIPAVLMDGGFIDPEISDDMKCTIHLLHIGKKEWLRLHETNGKGITVLYGELVFDIANHLPTEPSSLSDLLAADFEGMPHETLAPWLHWWQSNTDDTLPITDSFRQLLANRMARYNLFHFNLEVERTLPLPAHYFGLRNFLQSFVSDGITSGGFSEDLFTFEAFLQDMYQIGRDDEMIHPFFEQAEASLANSPHRYTTEIELSLIVDYKDSQIAGDGSPFLGLDEAQRNGVTPLHIFEAIFD